MKRKLLIMGATLSILVFCLSIGVRAGTSERPCTNTDCEDRDMGYAWLPYDANPSVHRLHCKLCGFPYSDPASGAFMTETHSGGTATCTQQAVCEVCGAAYGDLAAHSEVTLPAVAATCTQSGLTQGRHCSVCQAVLIPQEVIPALGHTLAAIPAVAATCTQRGREAGSQCTVCGASFPGRETKRLPHWYGPWTPNGDGTISADCKRTGCRNWKTVDSHYLEASLGGFHLLVCPVSGDAKITSEKVAAIDNLPQAITFQPIPGATAQALGNLPLPYGEFVALGMNIPFVGNEIILPGQPEQRAVVLAAMTLCFESGGSFLHSLPNLNQSLTDAIHEDFERERNNSTNNGVDNVGYLVSMPSTFFLSESGQPLEIAPVPITGQVPERPSSPSIGQAVEIAPAPGTGQTVELLRASGNGQWQAIPFEYANGSLSFETNSLGLFLVIQPKTTQAQEQPLPTELSGPIGLIYPSPPSLP